MSTECKETDLTDTKNLQMTGTKELKMASEETSGRLTPDWVNKEFIP
jgi:hypothetical protein